MSDREGSVVAQMIKEKSFGCAYFNESTVYHLPEDYDLIPDDLLSVVVSDLKPDRIYLYGTISCINDSLLRDYQDLIIVRSAIEIQQKTISLRCAVELGNELNPQFVEIFTFKSWLWIDKDSFQSLNIDDQLFDLISQCLTRKSSTELLRQWMKFPLTDINQLNLRLDLTNLLSSDIDLNGLLSDSISNIKSISPILNSPNQWSKISEFELILNTVNGLALTTLNIQNVKNYEGYPLLNRIVRLIDLDKLENVAALINSYIDFDSSNEFKTIDIKVGVNEELDQLKQDLENVDLMLQQYMIQLFGETSEAEIRKLPNQVNVGDLTFQFIHMNEAYYTNQRLIQLQEEVMEMKQLQQDLQFGVIQYLRNSIHDDLTFLNGALNLIDQLDVLIGFGKLSALADYKRPLLHNEIQIEITDGRHALQEQFTENFVPNDTQFGQSQTCVIVSGSNGSGKSVYLKQVALIQYIAQIGCFVPASYSHIPICRRILTKLRTVEASSVQKSAFKIDLEQVKMIMDLADVRSLILLDEFGKGTNTQEGAGLLLGVLKYLIQKHSPPIVLCATHFHQVLDEKFFSEQIEKVQFMQMSIVFQDSSSSAGNFLVSKDLDEDTQHTLLLTDGFNLTNLFKLIPGKSQGSYGIYCAKKAGLSNEILIRALEVNNSLVIGKPIIPKQLQTDHVDLSSAINCLEKFIKFDFEKSDIDHLFEMICDDLHDATVTYAESSENVQIEAIK